VDGAVAVLIFFEGSFLFVSSCTNVPMRVGKKANSFVVLALRVVPA
jgi:hypothetical protein